MTGLQPTAIAELRETVTDLRDRPADARHVAEDAKRLLVRIDQLLALHPTAAQRAEIIQIAHLLGRLAAEAHRELGNKREERWMRSAVRRLHKLAPFEPLPGP
ncbi:MAG: hypothetical protein AAF547_02480 [Actinomycetota bacterium]